MPEFTYEGTEELRKKISQMPQFAANAAEIAMKKILHHLHGKIPQYSESQLASISRPDGVSFLRTEKQRAWFFANARKGNIKGWIEIDGRHPEKVGLARTMTLD